MTIELTQPHTGAKAGSASKAADTRFKSGHGKSQPDALGGFQSILSAAADASSEPVTTGITLPTVAIGQDGKDTKAGKDGKSQLLKAEESILSATDAVPVADIETPTVALTSNDTVPAEKSTDLTTVNNVAPLLTVPISVPQMVNAEPLSETSVADQVSALLSQSRFLSGNSANTLPSTVKNPSQPQTKDVLENTQAYSAASSSVLNVSASNSTFKDVPLNAVGGNNNAILNDIAIVNPIANPSLGAQIEPLSHPSVIENAVGIDVNESSKQPTQATVFQPQPQLQPVSASVVSSSKLTISEAPSLQQNATNLQAGFVAPIITTKDLATSAPAKPTNTPVTDAVAQAMQSLNGPIIQPQSIQPLVSAANQETKAIEAAKLSTDRTITPFSPLARMVGQEIQDRTVKAAGFNEFKPWIPTAFAASNRITESSSSNAGKDPTFGTASNAMPPMSLMPQAIPSEIRINQWIDPAPAAATTATAAEILTGSSLGTEREILREQNAVFKINQPDVVPDLQTYSATGADNNFSLSSAEGAVPMETYVAEQVTYWINQDVQNAELTLEGIGLDPVQVNISMQGNEAFVTFTTDEQQARDALERARQQLEDMLQSQGIQLSGLSVGSHGSGNAGTQDRNPRQGNKQTVVTSVQPEIQENKPKSGRTSGSTLDLFV